MSVDSRVSQPSEQSAGCLLVKIFCRRLDNDFYSEIDQSPLWIYQFKCIQLWMKTDFQKRIRNNLIK